MTSAEVSLRKNDERKSMRESRPHDIESNVNLCGVSRDTFTTETYTSELVMPPTHPAQHLVDPITRESQVENTAKQKNLLENASDGSAAMTSAEVSLRKKDKSKSWWDIRPNDIESNGNHSGVPKDTFSTGTSTSALVMPPSHPAQDFVVPVMRQSQVENAAKEKSVLGNALYGSLAMTTTEASSRKKNKRKRRRKGRHNAIESNGNLSGVPKDAFSIETSTAALVVPPQHPAQHLVDPITRHFHVDNAAKEMNVLENASDGSAAMMSVEVSLRKKDQRKAMWESRPNDVESNANLSGVPKYTLTTETSTSLVMPPTHPAHHLGDRVMRQSQVENAAKVKNLLENASDGSTAMPSAEVSLRKKDKRKSRWDFRPNDIESNGNLSCAPKDTFSTETSMSATLVMPPTHPAQDYVVPVTRQSQVENAAKEKNDIGHALDGSLAMTTTEASSRKKDKRKRRRKGRHNAIESNGNLSGVPKDAFSIETSTAALVVPPQHPAQHLVDPITRYYQVDNAAKEKNALEFASDGSAAMMSMEVSLRKKDERKRMRESRPNDVESNANLSGVPKYTFSTETSTSALVMPPTHPAQHLVDRVMRQSQVENAAKVKDLLDNASDGSTAMPSAEVSLREKDKRKSRWDLRTNDIESNGNLSCAPKDTFSTETYTSALVMPPMQPVQDFVVPVTRQSQVENAAEEKNEIGNALDGSPEASSRKKDKRKRRQKCRHNAIESNGNLSGVPKDAFSTETYTAALVVPPQHPAKHPVDPITRHYQVDNAAKEKNALEFASDGSAAMMSVEVSLRKKDERKRMRESRPNDVESNANLSGVPKDTFTNEASSSALVMPPTHPAQHLVDRVMRQSQVENAAKVKDLLDNASDGSTAMPSAEVSLREKDKRKSRWDLRTNDIESNGNLSCAPKDTFSTETYASALVMPPMQPVQDFVVPVTRQSQVENAAEEKNEIGNALDGSPEASSRKKDKRKRRQKCRHNAIESNGNLSGVPKDAFSTETYTAALVVPPQHPAKHPVDPITRHYQVDNAAKEKNALEFASDGSAAMMSVEVSLRKKDERKRMRESRPNDVESNANLSGVPKDTFTNEASSSALVMPPTHPAQHLVDAVVRQSQVENAAKVKNLLENASDGSTTMRSAEVSLRKKDKRKSKWGSGPNSIESNGNISAVQKNAISTETATAAVLAMPLQNIPQYSVGPVTKQYLEESVEKENNVLEDAIDGSPAMTNVDVISRKRNKKRRRQKTGHNEIEKDIYFSAVPTDDFSPDSSTPTMDMPPEHPGQNSVDPVMRQSREENVGKMQNMIEKAAEGSLAMTSEEVNSRTKSKKRRRRKTRNNDIECSITLSEFPKDTFSPATSTPTLDMPSQYLAPDPVDQVMRQCQEENEGEEQHIVEKVADGSLAVASAKVNSIKKNKRRKRQQTRYNTRQSYCNVSGVSKDSISTETAASALFMLSPQPAQFLSLESLVRQTPENNERKEQNMLDKGSESRNGDHNHGIKFGNSSSVVASAGHFEKEFMSEVKLNTVGGDIADLSLVSKQDDLTKVSHFSLGRTITSYSRKKLLVLDLNGLLADFVPSVPEGYKPSRKIANKAVFKRPFCDDFLQFCFDRFHVGIWSSRKWKNVSAAVKYIVGSSASKLLFSWNLSHCTRTKFRTINDKHKPLVLKELRKLWEKLKPGLPWEKGDFNESNTLLLDDSPYKALRNPMHTAIFPYSYQYSNPNDASLGPGGDLRVYLEGLAMAENVQEYVASHPFGQPAITESDPHWDFYRRVKGTQDHLDKTRSVERKGFNSSFAFRS